VNPQPPTEPGADDIHRIYDVLVRYANAVDRHDYELLASCFAEDARAEYGGREIGPGRTAILDFLKSVRRPLSSMHILGNFHIQVTRNSAMCESALVAYHVEGSEGKAARIIIRGIRYFDRLEQHEEKWAIIERRHVAEWMTETPALQAAGFGSGPPAQAPIGEAAT